MGVLSPSDWTNAFSSDPTGAKAAANTAADTTLKMFNTTQANLAPYMQSGKTANNMLMQQLPGLTEKYDLSKYQNSPEYANTQNAMQGMMQQLQASAAANGTLGSGATATALQQNANKLAMQGYGQGISDYQGQNSNIFNMLNNISGSGQNAAAGLGGFGANVANQIGQNGMNTAAMNFGVKNSAQQNLSNNLGQGLGNWLSQDSGYGNSNAGWLGTQVFGNAGTAGTLYSSDMSLENASMGDSAGWFA